MNTLGQWLVQASDQLRTSAVDDSPQLDAQLLACHALGFSRGKLYAYPEHTLELTTIALLNSLLQRRLDGEPIAYITGHKEFWSIALMVDAGTLVPRSDTEVLVEKALELENLAPAGYILDLGTGSGAIAIAMARELANRQILAIDCDNDALCVARANAHAHTTGNMQLLRSSWMDCIADNAAAMVLSNPPYLASDDHHLETIRHEPRQALVSGDNGLQDIAYIVAQSVRVAKNGAPVIIEHGYQQADKVRQLLHDHGYSEVGTGRDLSGHERISFGFVSKTA